MYMYRPPPSAPGKAMTGPTTPATSRLTTGSPLPARNDNNNDNNNHT